MFKLALTYLCVLLESNQIVFLGVAITKYRTKTNYCNHCSFNICTVKFKPPPVFGVWRVKLVSLQLGVANPAFQPDKCINLEEPGNRAQSDRQPFIF